MFSIVRALIKKELIQTFRDRRMLMVIFVMPLIQTIVFGVAVTNEVKNLPVMVVDHDASSGSRELASALVRGGYFRIVETTRSDQEGEEALYRNRAKGIIVIPDGFHAKIKRGDASPLQIVMDGSDGNSATIAMGYILRILQELHLQKGVQVQPSLIATNRSIPPPFHGVEMETRVWYNPEMESTFFMIPGVITMILTIITTLLTAMAITKEKEIGTFEQLIVSPIRGWQLMLGKTIPYALLGSMDAVIVTLLATLVFRIPLNGPVWVLALVNFTYVLAMLGLGLFISTVSSSQQQAMMTVFALLFPYVILSDFFFPLENMPWIIRMLTYLNPMRYCLRAQREIFLKGVGWDRVQDSVYVLLGFAVAFLGYGAIRFRKSLAG